MSTYVITDLPRVRSLGTDRPLRSPAGQLRLTRRGRVVVFFLGLAAVLALSVMVGGGSVATSEKGTPAPTETVIVGQGDTLWAIASDVAAETGEDDVREVMAQIQELNSMDSGMLIAGQELRIPLVE